MSKLISVDNGVIWVESKAGEVFGVVDQLKVLDQDGLAYRDDTLFVLDSNDFDLEQDWEMETTSVTLENENGEACKLVFSTGIAIIQKQ